MTNQHKTVHCTETGVHENSMNRKRHVYHPYEKNAIEQIQLYGNTYRTITAQVFEVSPYSPQQNMLYKQCVYGIKAMPAETVLLMSHEQKEMIRYNHKKTQQLINLSKWHAVSQYANDVVEKIFGDNLSKLTKSSNFKWFMDETKEIVQSDNEEINMSPISCFGGKAALIQKLIELEILPNYFHQLKTA